MVHVILTMVYVGILGLLIMLNAAAMFMGSPWFGSTAKASVWIPVCGINYLELFV